jgi:hypothetical protein
MNTKQSQTNLLEILDSNNNNTVVKDTTCGGGGGGDKSPPGSTPPTTTTNNSQVTAKIPLKLWFRKLHGSKSFSNLYHAVIKVR